MAPRSGDGVGEGLPDNRSRRRSGTTARARDLRQRDNQAEALLWLELKRRKLGGHKFTRQLPIGPYFADFACREQWLVIEIDGSQHTDSVYDRRRDQYMRALGWSVLRFWNTNVLTHRRSVCETILAALDSRLDQDVKASDLRFVRGDKSRPPLRSALPTTSPPFDGGEEARAARAALPLPPEGERWRRAAATEWGKHGATFIRSTQLTRDRNIPLFERLTLSRPVVTWIESHLKEPSP